MKKIQDPLREHDVDTILSSISDKNARDWALEWRKKNLIYLGRFDGADAIILDTGLKSIETKKLVCYVMQKHFESPRSVNKDEL